MPGLEERVADLILNEALADREPIEVARAVLALVRQEQEKWTAAINANGIEWWWLSHTAPQEK